MIDINLHLDQVKDFQIKQLDSQGEPFTTITVDGVSLYTCNEKVAQKLAEALELIVNGNDGAKQAQFSADLGCYV